MALAYIGPKPRPSLSPIGGPGPAEGLIYGGAMLSKVEKTAVERAVQPQMMGDKMWEGWSEDEGDVPGLIALLDGFEPQSEKARKRTIEILNEACLAFRRQLINEFDPSDSLHLQK